MTAQIAQSGSALSAPHAGGEPSFRTAAGIPIIFQALPPPDGLSTGDPGLLRLHLEYWQLHLLRDFDQLLCLEGLTGVEHLPHQIETVRKVLRRFPRPGAAGRRGGAGQDDRSLPAAARIPAAGTGQAGAHPGPDALGVAVARGTCVEVPPGVLHSAAHRHGRPAWNTGRTRTACSRRWPSPRAASGPKLVAEVPWDLVIVDEAHHCKNRATQNWQLVNALKRRHLFLLTATPVQNNLLELYNLLTLLEPGHLKTETDFKRQYVRRGNPRDPRNRERLRSLLGEVMVRNTRSLVQMDLPPRYAQTILAQPHGDEAALYELLDDYLRRRRAPLDTIGGTHPSDGRRRRGSGNGVGRRGRPSRSPAEQQRRQAQSCRRWGGGNSARCCWPPAAMPARWPSRWRTSPATTRRRGP